MIRALRKFLNVLLVGLGNLLWLHLELPFGSSGTRTRLSDYDPV
jgi:hypothetical protein